jgi:hypothetical protein
MGLVTIFYCLRFGTSLFVASSDSRGYGGGIRPRLHTGLSPIPGVVWPPFITSRESDMSHHVAQLTVLCYSVSCHGNAVVNIRCRGYSFLRAIA